MAFGGLLGRLHMAPALASLLVWVAWLLLPHPDLHTQTLGSPSTLPPELQKVRSALDKYQDPIVAVHDGYFLDVTLIEPEVDPLRPQVLVYEPEGDRLSAGRCGVVRAAFDRHQGPSAAPWPSLRRTYGGAPPAHAIDAASLRCLALEEEPGRAIQSDKPRRKVPEDGLHFRGEGAQNRCASVGTVPREGRLLAKDG